MPQPEYPGLAASTNAAQINAITAILEAYGLSKPATSITATLAGGAAVGNAAVQITTAFTVTISIPAPAGGIVVTPAGTLSGDKFQTSLGGGDATTFTIAAGDSTVSIWYTPGTAGTAAVSITTSPIVTYAGSPKSVVVSA